ncbi:hypothetical protein [Litoreibacter arenae]|uniref:Uncharacterized protein n=1 Tax=Litoreibacter arenae DSM 19593 TaxID=1123360 RepID=S9QMR0_9RHOB|nr:hypothetical protein [Litoreibacter arenae]EPX81007.1 hypothetical protein thalar_00452 [Litoreibacter arenae DSM 19593]
MDENKKSKLDRFKEAVLQPETDDDEERFYEKLRKPAKRKPNDKKDEAGK